MRKKLSPEIANAMDRAIKERTAAGLRVLMLCYDPDGRPRVFNRYCATRDEFERIVKVIEADTESRLLTADEAMEWEQTRDVPVSAKTWRQPDAGRLARGAMRPSARERT
nr:hypothetical protein [Nitrosomonas nitrosa]